MTLLPIPLFLDFMWGLSSLKALTTIFLVISVVVSIRVCYSRVALGLLNFRILDACAVGVDILFLDVPSRVDDIDLS